MTKRTVVLSPATGVLLAMFSSTIFAQSINLNGGTPGLFSGALVYRHTISARTASPSGRFLLVNSLPVAEDPVDSERYVKLLELSGFSVQLDKVPAAVANSVESALLSSESIDPFELADIPFLRNALPAAFSTQTLYSAVLEDVQAALSIDAVDQLTQFYSTPLGKELRSAEINNSILDNADRFEHWFAIQGIASLPVERRLALIDLERAMQATRGAVDAMIGMQVAMLVSMTPVLPGDQQRSASDLIRAAKLQRPALTRSYHQSSLETLSFVFQEQSIDALRAYSAILKTDAGQHYIIATNNGLSRGLILAAEEFGQTLKKLLSGRIGQGV